MVWFGTRKLRIGIVAALIVVGLAAPQAGLSVSDDPRYPFCGVAFTSLGHFNASGTVTFDTNSLRYGGNPGGVAVNGIAVFVFDSITVSNGTTIVGVGSRPLALISKSFVHVDGNVNLSGRSATNFIAVPPSAGGAGGGAGGSFSPGAGPGGGARGTPAGRAGSGGGGFGGHGGAGGLGTIGSPGAGGAAYGNLATTLQGGSGGAGGTSTNGFSGVAGGGGGGGAVLVSAAAGITIGTSGVIQASGGNGAASSTGGSGGGSGGAIVLLAPTVSNFGAVRANGGHGGTGGCCGAGGGGGGGRIAVVAATAGSGTYTASGGLTGAAGGFAVGVPGGNGAAGVITFDDDLFGPCSADTTKPVVTVPDDITVEATSAAGATATYSVTATDDVNGNLTATCTPPSGSSFPLGSSEVSCSATDAAGNVGDASFTVTVVDTTAPNIASVTPSSRSLWPPNHRLVPISVAVDSTDAVSAPVCSITGVTSSEPDNGLGDGDTASDIQDVSGLSVKLRAERAGGGDGRTYIIAINCVDAAGNASQSRTTVWVAANQRR